MRTDTRPLRKVACLRNVPFSSSTFALCDSDQPGGTVAPCDATSQTPVKAVGLRRARPEIETFSPRTYAIAIHRCCSYESYCGEKMRPTTNMFSQTHTKRQPQVKVVLLTQLLPWLSTWLGALSLADLHASPSHALCGSTSPFSSCYCSCCCGVFDDCVACAFCWEKRKKLCLRPTTQLQP